MKTFLFALLISLAWAECENHISFEGYANHHQCEKSLHQESHKVHHYCERYGRGRFIGAVQTVCALTPTGCQCSTSLPCQNITVENALLRPCDVLFTCLIGEVSSPVPGYTLTSLTYPGEEETLKVWSRCPLGLVFDVEDEDSRKCCSCGPRPIGLALCSHQVCQKDEDGIWGWSLVPDCEPSEMPDGCQCIQSESRCAWNCSEVVHCEDDGCHHHHHRAKDLFKPETPDEFFQAYGDASGDSQREYLRTPLRQVLCASPGEDFSSLVPISAANSECSHRHHKAYIFKCPSGTRPGEVFLNEDDRAFVKCESSWWPF